MLHILEIGSSPKSQERMDSQDSSHEFLSIPE